MSEEKQKNNSFYATGFLVGKIFTRQAGEHTIATGRINILSRKKDGKFWVDVEAWNEAAETLIEAEGGRIEINDGYFTTQEWEDKETGDKKSKIVLTINDVKIISKGDGGGNSRPASKPSSKNGNARTSYAAPQKSSKRVYQQPADDDNSDIPF